MIFYQEFSYDELRAAVQFSLRKASILLVFVCGQASALQLALDTGTSIAPTGTPTFSADTVDPACTDFSTSFTPGIDCGPNNLVVRTNDRITYNLQVQGNAGGETNAVVVVTLPTPPSGPSAYLDWVAGEVPTSCVLSGDRQTATCSFASLSSATENLLLTALVRNTTPNATLLALNATATSTQTTTPISATVLHGPAQVSAAPHFDLFKNPTLSSNNRNIGLYGAKGPDGTTDGLLVVFPVGIKVNGSFKGIEPLRDPITFSDPIDLITASNATVQSRLRSQVLLYNQSGTWPGAFAGTAGGCFSNGSSPVGVLTAPSFPLSGNGGATSPYRTQQSGTCTVAQPGGVGTPLNISITGADTTATFFPTLTPYGGTLVPNEYHYAAHDLGLWIPNSVFAGISGDVTITNTFTNVLMTSISGAVNVDPDSTNESSSFVVGLGAGAGVVGKGIAGCVGTGCSLDAPSYDHAYDGRVRTNELFNVNLVVINTGAVPFDNVILCDKIENDKFNFTGVAPTTRTALGTLSSADYVIEYANGGGAGSNLTGIPGWADFNDLRGATCRNSTNVWFTDPTLVPGGLDAITKIRVRLLPTKVIGAGERFDATFSMRARANAIGTQLRDVGAFSVPALYNVASANVVDDGSGTFWLTNAGVAFPNNLGDYVTQSGAYVRLTKTTLVPTSGSANVTAGTRITYSLQPRVYDTSMGTGTTSVSVEEVLPPYTSYVPGSAHFGSISISPTVSSDTPSVGYTRLVFAIPTVTVNATDTPAITFDADVAFDAPNGTIITNIANVSSPIDPAGCPAGASVYPWTHPSIGLCRTASRVDLRVEAQPGLFIEKHVLTTTTPVNGDISYVLDVRSRGSSVTTTDIIDVMPYNGDGAANPAFAYGGRSPASNFHGTLGLREAPLPVPADPSALVYYTSAVATAIHHDPNDPSNAISGGSTRWCLGSELGTAGCPASLSAATAFRIISSTALSAGVLRSYQVNLSASGNRNADTYTNSFDARGQGFTFAVASASVNTNVVAATADLRVIKTTTTPTRAIGEVVNYQITVTNLGGSNVVAATLTDNVPTTLIGVTYTCSAAGTASCISGSPTGTARSGSGNAISFTFDLNSGVGNSITLNVSATANALGGITNTADVSVPVTMVDSDPTNNSSQAGITVNSPIDVAISKTDGVTSYTPGGNLTYTVIVSNPGGTVVTGMQVNDTLPSGLTLIAPGVSCVASAGASCGTLSAGAIGGSVLSYVGASFPASTAATLTITVPVTVASTRTGILLNTATATVAGDTVTTNNSAVDTDVQGVAGPAPTPQALDALDVKSRLLLLTLVFGLGVFFVNRHRT